jgi:hypothetical protein
MAQVTDRTVGANPTGFDMRTELNNIIAALESDNSGSSEPLNTVAYMKWLDTSNATYYYYKERNHDNTAWVTLFRYTVATKIMEVVSNGVVFDSSSFVSKTGNETINGIKTFGDGLVADGATITALRETKVAMGANDIDLATGNVFTKTITATTTLTVSNVLASGNANSFILELTNGGAYAITWFSGTKWSGGTAPTLTASGVDILGFYSYDGGTTWRGMVLAKDNK